MSGGAFEETIRQALRLATESVQPAADGLDKIRAKVAAKRARRPFRYALASAVRGAGGTWLRTEGGTRPSPLARACRLVASAFRADTGQDGRLGLLRPAVALATALIVVVSAAWALTTLPQILARGTTNAKGIGGQVGRTGPAPSGAPTVNASPNGGASWWAPGGTATPTPSPTCRRNGAQPASPESSPSPSPSPSTSSSPSPTASGSSSPAPNGSPTSSPSPPAPQTPGPAPGPASSSPRAAAQRAAAERAAAAQRATGSPSPAATSTPSASPSPSTSGSPGSCTA